MATVEFAMNMPSMTPSSAETVESWTESMMLLSFAEFRAENFNHCYSVPKKRHNATYRYGV
jgi:hypothetical protein